MNDKERARAFDALANPKTAADYGVSMPLEDYVAETRARGVTPPEWLPPELFETDAESRAREAKGRAYFSNMTAMAGSCRKSIDDEILALLLKETP